jgi:23S rRNA (adenine2503-C2)-methyltransferase
VIDPYESGRDGIATLLDGEPAYRSAQVTAWLGRGVDDPLTMTDLPVSLRERLAAAFPSPPRVVRHTTADGGLTHKLLLQYAAEAVESVLMLYPRRGRSVARATVCISTQAGCAMGCPFCATGQAGFRRHLGTGEIVGQVNVIQRLLTSGEIDGHGADHVTNVVFMGMGEPLANPGPTVRAVRWLQDRNGFNLSARSITVSTVGIVPGIRRLARLGLPITLAVSLHAPNDELRDELVPVNRQYPLRTLLDACREYRQVSGRRLTFEYVLIADVNDRLEHAAELAGLAWDVGCAHVNLIPMNPTPAVRWRAPSVAHQHAFAAVVERAGVPVTVRRNRGRDIDAACGQLYADYAMASGRTLPRAVGAVDRLARKQAEAVGRVSGRREPEAALPTGGRA